MRWFFFQAEDGIRDSSTSRGLGDVYKRQGLNSTIEVPDDQYILDAAEEQGVDLPVSYTHLTLPTTPYV